jgi:flagellar hook assembly protein FlgD
MSFRDNASGKFYNSIFTEFSSTALHIEDVAGQANDSRERFELGELAFGNNIFWKGGNVEPNVDLEILVLAQTPAFTSQIANTLRQEANLVVNPQISSISRVADRRLNPFPEAGSPALDASNVRLLEDTFFKNTTFVGAFGETNWLGSWSAVATHGFFDNGAEDTDGKILSGTVQVAGRNFIVIDDIAFATTMNTSMKAVDGSAMSLEMMEVGSEVTVEYETITSYIENEEQNVARSIKINSDITSVEEESSNISSVNTSAFPNPMTETITLDITVQTPSLVTVEVFSAQGALVAVIARDVEASSTLSLNWDGTDLQGAALPSGAYFYKVRTANETATGSLQIIR